jgi:hypothetical protein
LAEAKTALVDGKMNVITGGADLLGTLKVNTLPQY